MDKVLRQSECAWCGQILSQGDPADISHGICAACLPRLSPSAALPNATPAENDAIRLDQEAV